MGLILNKPFYKIDNTRFSNANVFNAALMMASIRRHKYHHDSRSKKMNRCQVSNKSLRGSKRMSGRGNHRPTPYNIPFGFMHWKGTETPKR
jgi:hypothetical protein